MASSIYVGTFPNDPLFTRPEERSPLGARIYLLDPSACTAPRYVELGLPYLDAAFLAVNRKTGTLYATNRTGDGGAVSAWSINNDNADLTLREIHETGGAGPCHLCLDAEGRALFVANYGGSSVTSFLLAPDGGIQHRSDLVAFAGSGPDVRRQEAAHPHMVLVDPVNGRLLVPDLGSDCVAVYDVDRSTGVLHKLSDKTLNLPPGSGPRHAAFFPDGDAAVVVNELASTMAMLMRSGDGFRVTDIVRTATHDVTNFPSAVRTSPDGSLVYVGNRGDNTVATFRRHQRTGTLSFLESAPCGGRPRDVVVDTDAGRLLVANHDNHSVKALALSEGGLPGAMVPLATIPNPASLVVWASPA